MTSIVAFPTETLNRLGGGWGRLDESLVTGQLSRRLALIHAVLTEATRVAPAAAAMAGLEESTTVLADAQRRNRSAANRVIRHPTVGAWAMRCLQGLQGPAPSTDHLGHFGAVAAAAALAAGLPFDVTVRLSADGSFMVPTCGLVRLDSGPTWARMRGHLAGGAIEVVVPGRSDPVRIDIGGPETSTWWPLRRLRSTVGGLAIELGLDDVDPYRDHHLPPVADRLTVGDVRRWQQRLDDAWALITQRQPETAQALSLGMVSLVPLRDDERTPSLSATTRDAVGAAGLSEPPTSAGLAEALIHEHRHSVLWALLDLVPLVDSASDRRFYAPWRSDPRPARGLLHGAYAYLGLLEHWAARLDDGPDVAAEFELALWRSGVRTALDGLAGSGLLTAAGSVLLDGMSATLDRLIERPIASAARLLAEDAALDQRVSWRLRNVQVSTETVERWYACWSRGEPAPQGTVESRLVTDSRRFAGSPRARLVRQRLAQIDPDDAGSEADRRLLDGEHAPALDLYRRAVARPDVGIDPWAGLALAARHQRPAGWEQLVERPELVRAVHARADREPDPLALAAWMVPPPDPR